MNLSKRLEQRAVSGEKKEEHLELKKLVRERLYEKIPPHGIAQLVYENPELARRELTVLIGEALVEVAREEKFLSPLTADAPEGDRVRDSLLDDIMGMGPIDTLIDDPSITEVMVNGTRVFFERNGRIYTSDIAFDDDEHVRLIIDRIIAPLGRRLDERTPLVNARLPQGHRVNAVIPPISLNGSVLTIRKFRSKIYSFKELIALGTLDVEMARFLTWAVKGKLNIAVTGGTSSGKTTLLNALSQEIDTTERIITIEDSAELRFQTHPHVISLEARPPSLDGVGEITIRDLVANSLRMRPDRIIVGECRGGEALDMLQAMNTGHSGSLTTLHANSPADAIARLSTLVRYAVDLPLEAIENQIYSALDLIVHQQRGGDGVRKIVSIVWCDGQQLRPIFHLKGTRCVFAEPTPLLHRLIESRTLDSSAAKRWVSACSSSS